jgi:hypothetical protein
MIKGVGSRIARGRGGPPSCKMGQLTHSMGRDWRKICIHALKATTPRWTGSYNAKEGFQVSKREMGLK